MRDAELCDAPNPFTGDGKCGAFLDLRAVLEHTNGKIYLAFQCPACFRYKKVEW